MCLPGIKPGIVLRNGSISICQWKDTSKETEGIPFISGRIGLDPKKQKEFDLSQIYPCQFIVLRQITERY